MKLIVHAPFDHASIRHSLGRPEYSYFFVQTAFQPVLETIGTIVPVAHPEDAEPIYDDCVAAGEDCVFLCFTPPHLAPIHLRCPVIPVFAWEYSTIPLEHFGDDVRSDWRVPFTACGRAIALSRQSAQLVRDAMGDEFPVFAIPTPSYEQFSTIEPAEARGPGDRDISLHGHVFDSQGDARFLTHRPWPHQPPPVFPVEISVPLVVEPVCEEPAFDEPVIEETVVMPAFPEPLAAAPIMDTMPETVGVPPAKRGARERFSITVQYAVNWYRHVLRDIMPRPVRAALSLAGRGGYRAYRLLMPLPPPIPVAPPPRRSARERLSLTAQYAVNWYRHAVKDIMPGPVRSGISRAGRAVHRAYKMMVPPAPAMPPPPPPPVEEISPAPPTQLHVEPAAEPAPPPVPLPPALPYVRVTVSGVVYAAVMSPQDGRKNWTDMVSAFVWALRERADATLVIKMPAKDAIGFHEHFDAWLTQLAPFQCRVIGLYGFLDDDEFDGLISASDYIVNTSSAEGLSLPLMEFLSAGRPALAPDHSAMADYISPETAFVLASSPEQNVWPHDPRELYTTMRNRLNWRSLKDAYEASFQLAAARDGGYAAMAQRTSAAMREFCAAEVVREKLLECLNMAPFGQVAQTIIREAAE